MQCVGSIGSFFGNGVLVSTSHGRVTNITSAAPQPRFVSQSASSSSVLLCAQCKQAFSHPPAFIVHKKFCKLRDNRQVVAEETQPDEQPPHTQHQVEAAAAEHEPIEVEVDDITGRPSKLRKTDGLRKQSGLKEGQHRTPYSLYFKYHVAQEFAAWQAKKEQGFISDPLQRTSIMFRGLSVSNIWNWYKQMDALRRQLTHDNSGMRQMKSRTGQLVAFRSRAARKATLHKGRQSRFVAAEHELVSQFKEQRRKGIRVNERWLCVTIRKLIREHYGGEAADLFKASYGWVWRFAHRNGLSLRRANNHKHAPVSVRVPRIQRWHARLRRRLKDAPQGRLHPKWGRWLPANRLSIDQVP